MCVVGSVQNNNTIAKKILFFWVFDLGKVLRCTLLQSESDVKYSLLNLPAFYYATSMKINLLDSVKNQEMLQCDWSTHLFLH